MDIATTTTKASGATTGPAMASAAPSLAVNVRRVMGHPGTRQLMGLAGIAGAIAVGLTIWFWSQGTAMAPLFTGLTPEDEMAVVQQLQTRQIPFEQQNGAVLIPTDQVHNMRLAMAAEGLPQGAGVGFELIRDAGSLGSSPFMENARYQHVLETELSRTVSSLHPVRAARIHLALPRRSAFVRPNETASAAVMVTLHPGRTLDAGQIAAIVHLVSSSVPQLADDRVSVVDQRGSLLNRPQDGVAGVGLDGEQLAFQARVEQRYMERILQLLQPFTGAERVSAQVMVDMDFSRAEQTREVFDPQSRTIRSEQTSEEMRGDTGGVGGIPGALSNRPPQTAVNAQDTDGRAGGDGSASLQTTRNYEINRTLEHTWQQPGRVQRVNAAVVVDHLPTGADGASAPLSAEQLERIEALVREAIGFDAARGDSINVQNLPFQALDTPEVDSLPLWQEPLIQDLIRQGLGLIVLLLVAFRLFRPAVSAVLGSAIGPDLGPERALATAGGGAALVPNHGADADDRAAYTSGTDTAPRNKTDKLDFTPQNDFDDKLAAVREVVGQDPARVANVVRGWINND